MELSEQDLRGKYWAEDYRRWQATGSVTEAADKDIAGKLLSGDWQQEYSAAAELWIRTRFELLQGLSFEYQPGLQGKTPDFLIRNRFGPDVVADVAVLHSGPLWDLDWRQQEYQDLRREMNKVETEHFATSVLSIEGSRSVKGKPGGPVSINKIIGEVCQTATELEQHYNQRPDWLTWEPQWMHGVRSATLTLTFSQLAIDLEIEAAFYLKEDETDAHRAFRKLEDDGAIGVMSGFSDDPGNRLERVLDRKITYLRKFDDPRAESQKLPYMVIIFDPDSSVEPMDMETVLHGPSAGYSLGTGRMYDDLRQWTQRTGQGEAVSYKEGLFRGRHKDFLAVLKCTGDFRSADGCELSIWVNPYASLFIIPQPLLRLKTYTLIRQIQCTPPHRFP